MVNPYINLTDEELMIRYQDDNNIAFEVLYHRYKEKIYTYLKKRVSSESVINDIFQKIFLKLHKTRNIYNSEYLFVKWIYTISRSVLLDSIKKKKLDTIEFTDHLQFVEEPYLNEFDLDSEKSLSTKETQALKMRYYEEKDFVEISKILETSESNSRKIISRGLKKLRKKYSGGTSD